MKRKLSLLFCLLLGLFYTNTLSAQVVIYTEDFDGALTWTLNTDPTAEGAGPNNWYISCEEEGVGAGSCATDCGAGNNTLHVGPDPMGGDLGAEYVESGLGVTTTNRRAESADISTIGATGLELNFDMIGQGNDNDFAEVFYSIDGGATWVSLDGPLTTLCCGGIPCTGAEEGLWAIKNYALPAACEEITNLRISFVWQNLDDGTVTNPSIGIDNVTITKEVVVVDGGPTALFDPEDITICQGETITYTDLSTTDDVISAWSWTFDGGVPATAATAGPHNVLYTTPGVYTTTLTVTDGIGSNDTSFTVTVEDGPYAGEPVSEDLCAEDLIDLNTLLVGADGGGTWTETSAVPSGGFTPATGVLDGAGLSPGDTFTFDYEVGPGVAPCPGSDIATVTITIITCEPLNASFVPSSYEICQDDCITVTDLSTGTGIINWAWTFSDGAMAPVAGADPGDICFPTAGSIDVTLTITDGDTFDDTTITIVVNPTPTTTATASPDETVCLGDEVTLNGGGADFYTWTGGVTDGLAFEPVGTATYTVTGANAFGCSSTADITVTVVDCVPLLPGFVFDDIICVGDCITFTDTTSGGPVEWNWSFGGLAGGGDPLSSTEQNPLICFNTSGIFNIQLTVTNEFGETASTTKSITVFDVPTVTAEMDTIIDLAGTADLIAVGSIPDGDYEWFPNDFVACETCPITTANPPSDKLYTVVLTDVNGCTAEDTVRVYVNFIESLGVPSAFSPNGDGLNDILFVKGFGFEKVNFTVYNKYGELLFESSEQNIGWDGTYLGRPQNPGVFTWVVEYEFINGRSGLKKGNTTLMR
jgi:gliding motility-associated-like protein